MRNQFNYTVNDLQVNRKAFGGKKVTGLEKARLKRSLKIRSIMEPSAGRDDYETAVTLP